MSTGRCRPSPLAVAIPPASTAGSDGSSSWMIDLDLRQPAGQLGDQVDDPLLQRLGDVPPGAGVGQHLVAARVLQAAASVHGPATAILTGPW